MTPVLRFILTSILFLSASGALACTFDSDCLEGFECESGECQSRGGKSLANVYDLIMKLAQNSRGQKSNCN